MILSACSAGMIQLPFVSDDLLLFNYLLHLVSRCFVFVVEPSLDAFGFAANVYHVLYCVQLCNIKILPTH